MPCIKLSSGKTVCHGEDTNKYPDGGPVNKNKPIVNKGVDVNAKPWMKDNDSWFENIVEFVDPTGISSWDDVRRARNNYGPDSSEAMIEMAGAIPFLGKIGKSGKIITGGFGLLQNVVKGSKYLPSGAQKKVLDKTYDLYQKYAKSGGKELDEILGSGSKLIRDNVPLLNPSLHASSAPVINSFNFLQKLGRGKTAYDAATGSKDNSGFKGGFGSNEPLQYDGRNVLPDLSSEYSYSQGGTIFFNHQPVHFPDGGEVDLKLNRVPKPVEDDFDMSGGFHGNLFHNVGARGELNYGPLNMSGQAMLSGYDKGWNPNVSSNLNTNVQVNPKLNVSGNLNYNYNKGEGSQFSPTIGANYQANPNLNIGGSFTPGSNNASFSIRKKFPDGGKTFPPIYTSDRNDPRLKSYQDSVYVRTKADQTFQKGNKTRPLTEKEKKEWRDERTGLLPNVVEYKYTPTTKYSYYGHYKKPVQPVIYKPIERTTLEPVESRTVPMLESNFEPTPITPMSVDRPMMQPSNEEYNRQYSIPIPTIEINKRQVAPRVNRVLGQNKVNPKNQYQRSIDVDTRQLPIMDEYTLNKLRMKLGMEPKGFQDGGKNTKTITLSTGKVITIK